MTYQVIDTQLAIQLAGNNPHIAEELFSLLLKTLPDEFANIKQAFAANDQINLLHHLHKLHGALNYCGVPKLKAATVELEQAAKNYNLKQLPTLFTHFELAVNELITSTNPFAIHQ